MSDVVDLAYRAGWLAFAARVGEILDGLQQELPAAGSRADGSAFVAGQEAAILLLGCRIAEAAMAGCKEGAP